jgi:AMP-binding enzyme/AMP-binding enzyme C-terminal domain
MMVSAAVEAIWEQVPAYRGSSDDRLRDDVAAHVGAVFGVFLAGLTSRRPARRADFAVTREQATRRRAQGISLADFLQAFRIGQLTLWQGVLRAAGADPGARDEALPVVAQIMQVIELGSTVAAEAYIEAQQYEVADSDRVRRDLLEDLLARHVGFAGLKRAMLRTAGLGLNTRVLVASAVCTGDTWDEHILRDAALVVGRAPGGGAYAGFATGATMVLLPRFDAELALSLMEREQVTFFAGVPTMYHALLTCEKADRFDVAGIAAGLRVAVSGGAALPAEVMRRFEERFGVPILEGYGLSETSPVATFNRVNRPRRPGSVGLPAWGVEVAIVRDDGSAAEVGEPGEIAIRGHNVMKGYFRRPAATAAAINAGGWFRTGDIGKRDADGYLYVVDRKKDLIIRGGFNVYPRELEEVLHTHADVSLAAVVGVPHDRLGEEVKAFAVRNPGAAISEAELISWCKQNMAAYKYPRLVEFRDSLPMTATGKILKRELARETASARGRP